MQLNFDEIKRTTSFEEVLDRLEIPYKVEGQSLRADCPICGSRKLWLTPSKQIGRCWGMEKPVDVIGLVAHIRGCKPYEAAQYIVGQSSVPPAQKPSGAAKAALKETLPARQEPAKEKEPTGRKRDAAFKPEEYAAKLNYETEAVQSLAPYLTPEVAKALVIGVAPSGIHQGRVTIAVRDETGEPVFFLSASDWKFPKKISL